MSRNQICINYSIRANPCAAPSTREGAEQARIRLQADGVRGAGGWAAVLRSSGRPGRRGEQVIL
ncbi:MAG: hypothetical protein PHU34_03400 [Candidatus Methanoperedens sp.]|nr:hypothetical protein [Candidatus Methanoperedens sp.]